ncbi:MAG: SDR family oxidoreductase [Chitinivibrionales bacterium]|nr:SDR family oxidoreductase [Chitinivibrionales bacterium]
MDWYKDKKVVITGGSSGIGKAAAKWLAQWGAQVCIIGRDATRLETALQEIKACAAAPEQTVTAVSADVADRAALKEAASGIVKKLGGIDVLINSAGVTFPGYLSDTPDTVWDSMMQIDYMGTVNAVRAFLPWFMEQRHGSIANISSVVGYMGVFGYAAYGAAKFAVVGFSECLRQDLLPYNINISVVYPPDTDTPQWHEENKIKPPETRALSGTIKVMRPEDVSLALLKGVSRRAFTIVPGAMNRFTYFMSRHLPTVVWMIVSGDLRKYWKKHPIAHA